VTLYKPFDIEAALVEFLSADPDLTGLHEGVSTQLPAGVVLPRIRLNRAGGVLSPEGWLDQPRVAIDCWADTKDEAWTLASTCLPVLLTRLAGGTFEGGVITGVRQELGLTWAPDPDTDKPRYTFTVIITTHPTPES
jgi:hypothetical protein